MEETAQDHQEQDQSPKDEENVGSASKNLKFDPRFVLGHPYLQTQWGDLQGQKRKYIINAVLQGLVVLAICVLILKTRLPYFFLYYAVPLLGLSFGTYKYIRWRKRWAELQAKEKLLRAASWALRDSETKEVRYSTEELGSDRVSVMYSSVPYMRVMVESKTSIPKFCGSWPMRNWKLLSESDRSKLHTDFKTYSTGQVLHGIDLCFAIMTDVGVLVWFV